MGHSTTKTNLLALIRSAHEVVDGLLSLAGKLEDATGALGYPDGVCESCDAPAQFACGGQCQACWAKEQVTEELCAKT